MILYPAIDLKDGKCVRMPQGDIVDATVYSNNALSQAVAFQGMGFSWLHIVDLNGAFSGKSVNKPVVERILQEVKIPVQVGGGIRDRAAVEAWLEAGVGRVILGTSAVKNPDFVREVARAHPDRIVVSIDARNGYAATDGWAQGSQIKDIDLARRFEDIGVAAFIYTDIGRDGTLAGPNVAGIGAFAKLVKVPVILCGGIKTTEHVAAVIADKNIKGAIIGRALYERTLDITASIALARKAAAPVVQDDGGW